MLLSAAVLLRVGSECGQHFILWKETLSFGGRLDDKKLVIFGGFSEQLHSYEPADSYSLNY